MEEAQEKKRFLTNVVQQRKIQQQLFLSKIKAVFNPLRILQQERKMVLQDKKETKKEFDSIGIYEVQRRKYIQIENPMQLGVFDSSKCYYVVFRKENKVSVVFWRGRNQALLNFTGSLNIFMETKFRDVALSRRGKGGAKQLRSASTIEGIGFKQNSVLSQIREKSDTILKSDAGLLKSPRAVQKDEEKKQTHIFQPVMQLQTTKDPQKLLKEKSVNLQPLKRDETIVEINLRSVVTMDNEPMYFQQAFQGGLV